jgi:hypothetical protein
MHKPLLVPTAMQNAVNDNKLKANNAVLKPPQSALKKPSKNPSAAELVDKNAMPGLLQAGRPDVLGIASKQLQQLEAVNKALKSEVGLKTRKVMDLEKENQILKVVVSPDFERVMREEAEETARLTRQVADMKKFLGDYGLVWVGRDGTHRPSEEEVKKAKDAVAHPPMASKALPREIDTEVLTKRIEELNFIAEKQRIVKNKDGLHHFKKHDE